MHTGIIEYVVFEARCLSFFFGGSVGTDMVVPRSVAMAAVTSSLWMAIVYQGGSRIRFFFFGVVHSVVEVTVWHKRR